jgi:hypothetical protein
MSEGDIDMMGAAEERNEPGSVLLTETKKLLVPSTRAKNSS